jgi:hypothetical protein
MLQALSVPIAAQARWAATAAPDPPDDPPGMREGSLGLRVVPVWGLLVVTPKASSWVLVLPSRTAPASASRRATGASLAGTRSR